MEKQSFSVEVGHNGALALSCSTTNLTHLSLSPYLSQA